MNQDLIMSAEELKRYKIKKTLGNIGIYTFLVLFALFIIIPFYWMFATSLRTARELQQTQISFIPKYWQFVNYKEALDIALKSGVSFFRIYFNTIFVGVFTTLGTLVTTILAAFAFARLNFKGKEVIFSIMLATMMIPGEIFVISNYQTVQTFGWKNTYIALILPFIVSVFYTYFLRQTFKQIPNELYWAAKVDGVGDFKYLWKVMIPLAKSTITSITILSMMGSWNAYVWPSLVANNPKLYLVTNGLINIYSNTASSDKPNVAYQMAAAFMVTVPLLFVFILLRKQIMNGVSRGGLKG